MKDLWKNSPLIQRVKNTNLYRRLVKSDNRTKQIFKNVVISVLVRVANILSSLLILPLTISYVNPTQYGIWLSLSTIITWVNFFDLGLGNGFRNKFAEAKAEGNIDLARQYVSTTYFAVTTIVVLLYSILLFANGYIDWTSVLKVDPIYREELQKVFAIVCGFMCLNMIANLFGTLLTADQKPGMSSIIQGVGQYMSLLVIFILTKVSTGSLTNLALYFSGVPCLVMLIASVFMFNHSSYRTYRPAFKNINLSLIKSILGQGMQFFIIYLCLIMVFQIVNIVLSREVGALGVTEYNITNRYFNILYMIAAIVVAPYWSAFTDAYVKKDFIWMKSSIRRLEKMCFYSMALGICMLLISPIFYKIWIGDSVDVRFVLSICVFIMTSARMISGVYMNLINGIGSVRIQMITYICLAIISWPSMVYSCRLLGICGIVIVPSLAYIVQAVLAKIQLQKHINGTAQGIWSK